MRLLLAVAMLPLAAAAQSLPVVDVDRQVFAAVDGTHTRYNESFPGGVGNDSERGWTAGFGVGARWTGQVYGLPMLTGGIAYHRQSGTLAYRGAVFDTGVPIAQSSGMVTNDVTADLGPAFLLTNRLLIAPVLQGGYHHWSRRLSATQAEDYRHYSVGAAVRVSYAIAPKLVATAHAGVSAMIDPAIDIHFRGTTGQRLGSGPIYSGGAKLDYAIARPLHVFAAADVTHFGYGQSQASLILSDLIIFEPASTTTTVTLSAGIGVGF